MGLFASYHVRRKGIPKTMGLWRRFCILLPPRAKGCRAGARNIPARGMKGTSNGPSGPPASTGCVYLGAPVFGKPPIWTQQSRCTITDRRVSARCVGAAAAAGMGVQAIRCGTFLYRGWNRTREIQKPLVFGGVLFHISFAVERNMAAGGKCRTRVQPAIGERKTGRRGRRPLRGARPETWRDTCGRGVPIGGVQTRDAGTGGVFRQAVIDRCGPSGRRI